MSKIFISLSRPSADTKPQKKAAKPSAKKPVKKAPAKKVAAKKPVAGQKHAKVVATRNQNLKAAKGVSPVKAKKGLTKGKPVNGKALVKRAGMKKPGTKKPQKTSEWWEKKNYAQQQRYLELHPRSPKKITRKKPPKEVLEKQRAAVLQEEEMDKGTSDSPVKVKDTKKDDEKELQGLPSTENLDPKPTLAEPENQVDLNNPDTSVELPSMKEIPRSVERIGNRYMSLAMHKIKRTLWTHPKINVKNAISGLSKLRQGQPLNHDEKKGLRKTAVAASILAVGALVALAYFTPLQGLATSIGIEYANSVMGEDRKDEADDEGDWEEEARAKREANEEKAEQQRIENEERQRALQEGATSSTVDDAILDNFIGGLSKWIMSYDPKELAGALKKKYGVQ